MNKRRLFVLVVIGLSVVLLFSILRNRNTQLVSTSSTISPTQEKVVSDINKEFSKKYNKPLDAFILTLDTELGDYAKGSVQQKGEGGGGLWFAVKVNNGWQLVYDGNGIIPCKDLKQYPDFPSNLIPQCFDDSKNMLIER